MIENVLHRFDMFYDENDCKKKYSKEFEDECFVQNIFLTPLTSILLTQICLILTSISNYYDRKIWRRKIFHSAGLEIAVQCNAIHL